MVGLIIAVSALVGLMVGSFLNVVIHRVPAGESIVHPRSKCPRCGTELRSRDNVPVVSWLLLRGKCRTCAEPISARYPAVEVLTAVLFAAVAARLGEDWALPAFLVLTAALVALSAIDLETFRLPTPIIYVAGGLGFALLAIAAVVDGDGRGIAEGAAGAVIAFGVLFVINFVYPKGMGFGDVRLAGLLGLFLGWIELPVVAVGLFFGFLLASIIGVGLIATGIKTRKDKVPFGPFLAAGALLAVFVGPQVMDLYLGR